jgi:hypothetical protein
LNVASLQGSSARGWSAATGTQRLCGHRRQALTPCCRGDTAGHHDRGQHEH